MLTHYWCLKKWKNLHYQAKNFFNSSPATIQTLLLTFSLFLENQKWCAGKWVLWRNGIASPWSSTSNQGCWDHHGEYSSRKIVTKLWREEISSQSARWGRCRRFKGGRARTTQASLIQAKSVYNLFRAETGLDPPLMYFALYVIMFLHSVLKT